jgi:hypothetical protein
MRSRTLIDAGAIPFPVLLPLLHPRAVLLLLQRNVPHARETETRAHVLACPHRRRQTRNIPSPAEIQHSALGALGDGCAGARIFTLPLAISGAVAPVPVAGARGHRSYRRGGAGSGGAVAAAVPGAWPITHLLKTATEIFAARRSSTYPARARNPARARTSCRTRSGSTTRRSARPQRALSTMHTRHGARGRARRGRVTARAYSRSRSRYRSSSFVCVHRHATSAMPYAAHSSGAACMLTVRAADVLGEHGGAHPHHGLDERARPSSARWAARVARRPGVRQGGRLALSGGHRQLHYKYLHDIARGTLIQCDT